MAELNESNMNFAALRRVDPYAKSLLETAAHVALYTFGAEWEKTDIEGALFVYSRTGKPYHNILIMNRLNMKNLVEPVTEGLDLQLQNPFLLYRTSQGSIYGIWFYDKEECVKIAAILTKIVKESSENRPERRERIIMDGVGNSVDIFSMLTKAQEEYNSKSPRQTHPEAAGAPLDVNFNLPDTNLTPQSVVDFFAKASNGSKFVQDPSVIQPTGMFLSSPRSGPPPGLSRMPSVPIAIPPPQSDVKPLLQRLMSNPAHSVEHIEKQQRAITPQNDIVSMIRNDNQALVINHSADKRNNLSFNVKPSSSGNANEICTPNNVASSQNQIENNLGFLRISDSPPAVVHTQQFFNSKITQNHSPLMFDLQTESNNGTAENARPLSAPTPALMPPVMFTSSVKKNGTTDVLATTPVMTANTNLQNNAPQFRPEPLTKNQLLQAVNHLLKHDPEFITKLHEAYVKSFAELVP